jgi:radical SAM protein with 4Fe4S-binding SPASM domain
MSDCAASPGLGWLMERLLPAANERRIPLCGTLELTRRCNLRCGHCYVVDHSGSGFDVANELSAAAWEGILDELAGAGCLWLGLTGGEPLVHPGFESIYRAAKGRGFLVTVLSNGTLITDEVADLLADSPPLSVELSVYGASSATCERVTGSALAFDDCLAGIRRLKDRGVRVSLKTALTRDNAADLPAMRRLAQSFDAPFRFDGVLNAHLDRRTDVTGARLDPGTLVELELAGTAAIEAWARRAAQLRREAGRGRTVLDCGAAVSAFHVDPRGRLSPCTVVREPAVDISRGGFAAAWNGPLAALARQPASPDAPCAGCDLACVCDYCGGFGLLENGDLEKPVDFVCAVARARREALERLRPETRWVA